MNKKYIVSLVGLGLLAAAGAGAVVSVSAVEVTTKGDAQIETERLLPTVNKKTTAEVTVSGWDDIKKQEIEGKIQTALENNPQVTYASIGTDSILVNYRAPAKFLGVFSMNMNINLATDADGRIKVKFPWYRFLVTT